MKQCKKCGSENLSIEGKYTYYCNRCKIQYHNKDGGEVVESKRIGNRIFIVTMKNNYYEGLKKIRPETYNKIKYLKTNDITLGN